MEKCLHHFFKQYHIDASATFLVALSGGADSMTLLHLLTTAGIPTLALHCNFQLRGDESDADQAFVTLYCQQHDVPLHIRKFETTHYAQQHGISIEMAARDLRYEWFKHMLHELQADYLVVGHHADDQAETILINLCRGTALKGLAGIQPINESIIRPLLSYSRDEIMQYIHRHHIPYRNDSTNATDAYIRNKIRHQVIPILKEINPSLLNTITHNCQVLSDMNKVLDHAIEQQIEICCTKHQDQIWIDIDKVMALPAPSVFLFSLLHPFGFSKQQIEDIFYSATTESGRYFYSATHTLVRERTNWQLFQTRDQSFHYSIETTGTFHFPGFTLRIEKYDRCSSPAMNSDPNIAFLDANQVVFPLSIRNCQIGDYFYPISQKSFRKKISDFFKDLKFTEYQKQTTPILTNGKDILWVMGHRIDNRFKLTAQTCQILVCHFQIT